MTKKPKTKLPKYVIWRYQQILAMSLNGSKVFWVGIPKYRKVAVVTLFTSSFHHHLTWLRAVGTHEIQVEKLGWNFSNIGGPIAAVLLASLKSGPRMYLVTTLKFGHWSIRLIEPKSAFNVYPTIFTNLNQNSATRLFPHLEAKQYQKTGNSVGLMCLNLQFLPSKRQTCLGLKFSKVDSNA